MDPDGLAPLDATANGNCAAAPSAALLRSWQYRVTGKAAVAQVLIDTKAEPIANGACVTAVHAEDTTAYTTDGRGVRIG